MFIKPLLNECEKALLSNVVPLNACTRISLSEHKMKVENISSEDALSFLISLRKERKYFTLSLREVLNSDFVLGCWFDENLGGIGGILKTYHLLPTLFVVVKTRFQGKRLGSKLMESIIRLSKESYAFLCLTALKKNRHALSLYRKYGFTIHYDKGEEYLMSLPLNRMGEILSRLLPFFLRVFYSLPPSLRARARKSLW